MISIFQMPHRWSNNGHCPIQKIWEILYMMSCTVENSFYQILRLYDFIRFQYLKSYTDDQTMAIARWFKILLCDLIWELSRDFIYICKASQIAIKYDVPWKNYLCWLIFSRSKQTFAISEIPQVSPPIYCFLREKAKVANFQKFQLHVEGGFYCSWPLSLVPGQMRTNILIQINKYFHWSHGKYAEIQVKNAHTKKQMLCFIYIYK